MKNKNRLAKSIKIKKETKHREFKIQKPSKEQVLNQNSIIKFLNIIDIQISWILHARFVIHHHDQV